MLSPEAMGFPCPLPNTINAALPAHVAASVLAPAPALVPAAEVALPLSSASTLDITSTMPQGALSLDLERTAITESIMLPGVRSSIWAI